MKPKMILLGLFLLLSSYSWSQEKRKLDWQKFSNSIGETKIIDPVQFGKFTVFEIDNINKFLYKVEMSGKSFELQTPIPSELQALFRLNTSELEKTATVKKANEGVDKIGEALPPMNELKKQITAAKDNASSAADAAPIPVKDSTAKAEKLEEVEAILEKLIANCKEYWELSKIVSLDIFELKQNRNKLISIAQLDMPHHEILSKVDLITPPSATIKNNYFELKKMYHEVEGLYEEVAEAAAEAGEKNVAKTQQNKIKKSSRLIEEGDELIDQESLLSLFNDVEFLYTELGNKNNFTAVAPPVQMDDDFVTYTVNITPTSTRALAAHRSPMEFKFDVPTRGGWKSDFSVGPVISFGAGSRDFKYYIDDQDGDKLKKRENRNDISPSIAALMHFYPRTGRNAAFGGLFGVGAGFQAISDVNLSLFTGLTYVLGKKQKIMLNGGLSFLRVDRLKLNQYKEGGSYGSAITLDMFTEKVFKTSPFLSITYNLATRIEN